MASNNKRERLYKLHRIINYVVRLILVGALAFAWYEGNMHVFFITLITLLLTFSTEIFRKKYDIIIPVEFDILIILFIYATLFLGEIYDFYYKYWWWDTLLHGTSAFVFGLTGFLILFVLQNTSKIKTNPIWIATFAFAFAVSIGALWEIFEFGMDQIFGLNMQKSGLIDTMWDLIIDVIGALIASIIGFFYLKGESKYSFKRLMDDFINNNPKLFRSKK